MNNPALMELAERFKDAIDTNMMDGTARRTLHKLTDELRTAAAEGGEARTVNWPPRAMKGDDGVELRDGYEFLPLQEDPNRCIDEAATWNRCLDECQRAYQESFGADSAKYPYDPKTLAGWLRVHHRGMWENPRTRIPEIVWIYETLLHLPLSITPDQMQPTDSGAGRDGEFMGVDIIEDRRLRPREMMVCTGAQQHRYLIEYGMTPAIKVGPASHDTAIAGAAGE